MYFNSTTVNRFKRADIEAPNKYKMMSNLFNRAIGLVAIVIVLVLIVLTVSSCSVASEIGCGVKPFTRHQGELLRR